MGSNSIFGVLALMVFFGLINSSLNERDRRAADDTYGYIKYTTAHEIARSGINIALKRVADSSTVTNVVGVLDGGSYNVSLTRINDTLNIVSSARFSDTTYRIISKLIVYSKPFPGSFGAAVGLDVDNVNFTIPNDKKSSGFAIDGFNHDTSGNRLTDTLGVPGVAVTTATDTTKVLISSKVIDGTEDVVYNPGLVNPADFVDEYIAQADTIISTNGNLTGGRYGSAVNPAIVYINGGADPSNDLKITGTFSGWGILVIHGSATINGTFDWKGLVIVYGNTNLEFDASSGNAHFIGAVLMGGPSGSTFYMNGKARIEYSTSTLNTSKNIGKLLAYHILDWYE